jgi:hypothetical protein
MSLGEIFGVAAAAALLVVGAVYATRWLYGLRGARLVACPETGRTVAVDLDLKYSALHSMLGRPHFRLRDCSRWPERAGCGQMCLGDLEAAPHDCLARTIVAKWYEGKSCAYCGHAFGEIHWHDHAPAVRGADHITRQWKDVPPETLPEVMATCKPVCWNCHIAETFRREFPDLVVDRPPRPMPPPM